MKYFILAFALFISCAAFADEYVHEYVYDREYYALQDYWSRASSRFTEYHASQGCSGPMIIGVKPYCLNLVRKDVKKVCQQTDRTLISVENPFNAEVTCYYKGAFDAYCRVDYQYFCY